MFSEVLTILNHKKRWFSIWDPLPATHPCVLIVQREFCLYINKRYLTIQNASDLPFPFFSIMRLKCCVCGKEFPEYDQRGFRNAGFTAHQNRCIERERSLHEPPVLSPPSRRVLLPAPPRPSPPPSVQAAPSLVSTATTTSGISFPLAIASVSSSGTDSGNRNSAVSGAYHSNFHHPNQHHYPLPQHHYRYQHHHQYQHQPQHHSHIREYYRNYNASSRTRRRHSYQGSHLAQNDSTAACHQPLAASPMAWFYPSTPVTTSATTSAPSIDEIMSFSEDEVALTISSTYPIVTPTTTPMTMTIPHDPYQGGFTPTPHPFAFPPCDYCLFQHGLHDMNCPLLSMFQSSSDTAQPHSPPAPSSTGSDPSGASPFPYRTWSSTHFLCPNFFYDLIDPLPLFMSLALCNTFLYLRTYASFPSIISLSSFRFHYYGLFHPILFLLFFLYKYEARL